MKFFWTFIWGFILIHMLAYVANSMLGLPYEFKTASILAVGAVILFYCVVAAGSIEQAEKQA
ncbi:YjzD family protein [Bacillus sp. FSL K6-3431]|uniref:YjzD family protein n=1 Tax=Bacillus sp. FSL K6-3431 TaxID=2921500 RepID=UPI0030FA770F